MLNFWQVLDIRKQLFGDDTTHLSASYAIAFHLILLFHIAYVTLFHILILFPFIVYNYFHLISFFLIFFFFFILSHLVLSPCCLFSFFRILFYLIWSQLTSFHFIPLYLLSPFTLYYIIPCFFPIISLYDIISFHLTQFHLFYILS